MCFSCLIVKRENRVDRRYRKNETVVNLFIFIMLFVCKDEHLCRLDLLGEKFEG